MPHETEDETMWIQMVDSPRFYIIHFYQFEAMDAKSTS